MTRRRSHWGWGFEDQQPPASEREEIAKGIRAHLGFGADDVEQPVPLEAIELPRPAIDPPGDLAGIFSEDPYERVRHAVGRAYRDVVRVFRGQIDHPPDLVAFPRDEGDVERILEWAAGEQVAVIPYGGGTSVVGGVEPAVGDGFRGAVTLDLRNLSGVREVDPDSRSARIGAGTLGPDLEDGLREQGLTLRCFPQSFEFSTLGGWIATRAGGHYATGKTHIDDLVASIRAVTPTGTWESRRLPGSGAGPSPDRLLLGSEGTLGVITEAWVRVVERPVWRSSCGVRFKDFASGVAAVRELAQSGLSPSNCRLLDEAEATLTGAAPPDAPAAVLVLGFESAHHPVEGWLEVGVEACRSHGGEPEEPSHRGPGAEGDRAQAEVAWRSAFTQAPFLRDTMIATGILADTFETAIPWDGFEGLYAEARESAERAVTEACGDARVTCRFTHVYPDGPAPYFTVLAPAVRGSEAAVWDEVKAAAAEAILAAGGTITHHHAVGRDHRPWYDRQRPDPFARALGAAKRELDPAGVLNPGVLIGP